MSPRHANPSPDIAKLTNEGYEVEIRGTYLLISHVPYVASTKTIQYGTLVSTLDFAGDCVTKPGTHVVYFIGSHPCHKDGSIMVQIQHSSKAIRLTEDLEVNHSFSNKPEGGYADYYEKMTRYVEVISAPAQSLDPMVKAKTFRVIESKPGDSVFKYVDTNSSRAEIEAISAKLKGRKIGIVGLGGTGSYILDLVAKTPVVEIHLFDGDVFAQHNAFRAPGAPTLKQLRIPPPKVRHFGRIYSKMRLGIHLHHYYLNASNVDHLESLDFVFICLDKGSAKKLVIEYLENNSKSFIDVGMGINVVDETLIGIVRTTTSVPAKRDHLRTLVSFDEGDDDEYSTNIQIAELNMLNAALAVVKWKKLCGFYQDLGNEYNCTYSINVNQLQ